MPKADMQRSALLPLLLLLCLLPLSESAFTFRQLVVTASSYVTNVTTSYTIYYEHYRNQFFATTAWATTTLTPSDTATLTFPNEYTLPSTITCTYSINSTGTYSNNNCTVVGNIITLGGLFNNVLVYTLTVIVNGVNNPYPAGQTSTFSGTIGPDSSNSTVAATTNSRVTITAAQSACGFTFNPNYVYTSSTNLIMTVTTVNQFPATGTIGVQFASNRKWSQDLVSTRTMPISTGAMVCNNQSANVNSGVQCTGDQTNALVTVSNVRSAVLPAGSTISFSINNFNSPPTNQAVDQVIVSTYTSTGASIDQCTAYVSGLIPKVIPSTQFSIVEQNLQPIVVNGVYSIKIDITTIDVISLSDYMTVTLPTGSYLTSFNAATVAGSLGINTALTSYTAPTITVYFSGSGTISAGFNLFIVVPNFVAPPSTSSTNDFVLTFLSSTGFPKMTSTQVLTAIAATLPSGSTATATLPTINQVTSYAFKVTISHAITSSGYMKLTFPTVLGVASNSACAAVVGTNMAVGPTCTYSALDNSMTFTNLNSTTNNIGAQTFTITVSGITNPPSTLTTGTFGLTTYYSSAGGIVETGTIPGITATAATIDFTKASVSASNRVNSATAVTYYLSFVIANAIPAGGYILAYFPTALAFDTVAAASSCQIMLDSGTATSTTCTAALSTSYVFNFTNPLSSGAAVNTNITLVISASATNPTSTRPFQPFSIYTYHSNGALIASLVNALSYSTTTASTFSSHTVTRVSNTNAALTTYTVTITQIGQLEANGIIEVTFPARVQPNTNSTCSLTYNSATSTVACSLSGQIFTVTSIPSAIAGGTPFSLTFTNIRNPYSFTSLTGFASVTKTANNLYIYSSGTSPTILQNTVATPFTSITYSYSPRQFGTTVTLQLSFEFSQYTVIPSYLLLSVDTYFTVGVLTCSSFLNFIGTCSNVSSNTIRIDGTFNNSVMGLTVGGFSSPNAAPSGSTFTTLASFDSSAGKIDQNLTTITFSTVCTLPCRTCTTNTSACLSCYTNTNISNSIYFYSTLSNCYTTCPGTTYNNATTLTCQPCSANCLNCQGSPTFCTGCHSNGSFPYLNKTSITVQVCVANCGAGYYPDASVSPTTCTLCVSPCATCTTQTSCITCASGFFLNPSSNNSCTSTCPAGTTIANNATNTCDACSTVCLTCSVSTSNCTACSSPAVFYNGSCQSSCPSGGTLAPQNGICTACDSTCLYCNNTITNCTACNLSSIYIFLVSNACLQSCPQTFYNVSLTGQCIACATANINCVNCSSATTCLSCDSGFVFHQNQCLSTTPVGFVNISGVAQPCTYPCSTCSVTQTNCTACASNSTLALQNNLCSPSCTVGKVAINQVCLTCTPNCSTCSNTQTNCTSCLAGLTPQVYLTSNICQQVCPNFTYANSSTLVCQNCVSPCLLCTSYLSCVSCVSGRFLEGTNCVTTCASGFTGVGSLCQACTGNCKTCSGSTNHCLTCNNGTYFLNSSNSCVTTCQPTMFIDAVNQICVGCTSPCSACVNSSTTCTSCASGFYLHGTSCIATCPGGMFAQGNTTCVNCSANCTTCTSTTVCTLCAGVTYLYNGACIDVCPSTAAVVKNGQCTACSTQNCYSCSAADVCQVCTSSFLYLNTACISACPSNYTSNGTHCIYTPTQTIINAVTTPSTFPVPFTIAGAVVVVACLMSKLQYAQTFLSGAIFAFFGLLQLLALVYFLFLYYLDYVTSHPTAFWLGLAALGYLYILNVVGSVAQPVFLCYQKQFLMWKEQSGFHKCFYGFVNICSTAFSHKIRNILFCKLFTFKIFSAKLDNVNHFRIFNIFSLLSLGHSGAAIFAAAIAITYIATDIQLYYQCIDVIVLHAINVFMAFFNTHKEPTFFQEITPQGLSLHKRNTLDEDFFPDKIKVEGHDGQIEEGFMHDYSHALQSKAALRFEDGSDIYSSSMENISESKEEEEAIQYEEISVQAVDLIDQKVNVTAKTNNRSMARPVCESISIQADELIDERQKGGISLSDLPQQFPNDSSNFTNNYFPKVDMSVQGNLDRANHDISIQKSYTRRQDVSIQPSHKYHDVSVAASYHNRSYEMQYGAEMLDEGIQPTIGYNDVEVQPSLGADREQVAIQYENDMEYDQFEEELHNSNAGTNVIFDNLEQDEEPESIQHNLAQQRQQQLVLQPQNIKSYEQQLQDRIRQKQKELTEVKRKIMMKERMNQRRQEQLEKYPVQEERVELGEVRYVEQRPTVVAQVGGSQNEKGERVPSQLGLQSKQMPRRQRTVEEIHAGREDRSSTNNKTIEQIEVTRPTDMQQPQAKTPGKIKVQPKSSNKKINYKQIDQSLQSQSEQPGPNTFVRSNVNEPAIHPVQSSQTKKAGQFIDYEKFQDDGLESEGRGPSEATRKQFKTRGRQVDVEVIEVDRSLGDEGSSQLESDVEPTGILNRNEHVRPKIREASPPDSDLSGTIEQIPKQFNKVDNDRTISNSSIRAQPQGKKQSTNNTKLQQKDVFDYYSGQINAMHNHPPKSKEIPREIESDKYNIGKLNKREEEAMPSKVNHPSNNRAGSTFAMAGRAQFTDDIARKRSKQQRGPLDIKQKWQSKHQEKEVSFEESRPTNNRQNLVRNKQLQNFASHLVLPQQSDKQSTSFQKAVHKKQKQDKPVSENKIQFQRPSSRRDLDQIQVHFQAEQFSNQLSSRARNQAPQLPRTRTGHAVGQKVTSQVNSDYYNEYEDDGEQIDYRGMMLMNQMQERPNNEDLQEYYRRKQDKGGRRRSNSKVGKSTEKIYMQRLDKKR